MQRMIRHDQPLPPCADGHVARHIHDLRGRSAGGGHLLECACRHTGKHDDYAGALTAWCALNGHANPQPQRCATIHHLGLTR